jgi:hypothetical protein
MFGIMSRVICFYYKLPYRLKLNCSRLYWLLNVVVTPKMYILFSNVLMSNYTKYYKMAFNNKRFNHISITTIETTTMYIRVITKLPNSEQSYKGKVKTHKYINRQNQSTTGKLGKP